MSFTARRRAVAAATAAAAVTMTVIGTAPGHARDAASRARDSVLPAYGDPRYDVTSYDLHLIWHPDRRAITGRARIAAAATRAIERVALDLDGLTVTSITVNRAPATWTRRGHRLRVTPRHPIAATEKFTVTVRYTGTPHAHRAADHTKSGWIRTADGAVALSQPIGSETWFPVSNRPADKARYTIAVTVPRHLKAASNGELVTRERHGNRTTWRWRERHPMAPYLATVAIGRFDMVRGTTATGVPLLSFLDSRTEGHRAALRDLDTAMRFAEHRFGRYPFTTAGVIIDRNDAGYALETQGRPVMEPYPGAYLTVHEIAHQWFGNSVTPADWRDIWLNEGFATYAEWLFEAWRHDDPTAPQAQFDDRMRYYPATAKFWTVPPGNPGTADRLFHAAVYERGAMTLHALRTRIGDDAFFTLLRRWTTEHAHDTVTTRDFIDLAEQVAGTDLDPLFDTWLYRSGKPTRW